MKRLIATLFAVSFTLSLLAGCTRTVSDDVEPEKCFSHYAELTALYGTPRMDTPAALGFDLQAVENISDNRWGFPIEEEYADLNFDISINFSGKDYHFSGVCMERVYKLPEEETDLLMDAANVCKQLSFDFGKPNDTSYFFNWVEAMMGEEWNRDIKFWQDPSLLKRVVDEDFSGNLVTWDLTPVATTTIKKELESYDDRRHTLTCNIYVDRFNDSATLWICY